MQDLVLLIKHIQIMDSVQTRKSKEHPEREFFIDNLLVMQADLLGGSIGALERIRATPLPIVYGPCHS